MVRLQAPLINQLSLGAASGVLIQNVEPDGPANNAQLQQGDVILSFNDRPVTSIDDLHKLLDETSIGRKCSLEVIRNRQKTKVDVVPGELK